MLGVTQKRVHQLIVAERSPAVQHAAGTSGVNRPVIANAREIRWHPG
jgi:hypothetical protein